MFQLFNLIDELAQHLKKEIQNSDEFTNTDLNENSEILRNVQQLLNLNKNMKCNFIKDVNQSNLNEKIVEYQKYLLIFKCSNNIFGLYHYDTIHNTLFNLKSKIVTDIITSSVIKCDENFKFNIITPFSPIYGTLEKSFEKIDILLWTIN